MNTKSHPSQTMIMQERRCGNCGSREVQFVEFDRVVRRLDQKKILVMEIWVCTDCGKEFETQGVLYSPEDVNRIKLRVAILSWSGYVIGTLLAYAFLVR